VLIYADHIRPAAVTFILPHGLADDLSGLFSPPADSKIEDIVTGNQIWNGRIVGIGNVTAREAGDYALSVGLDSLGISGRCRVAIRLKNSMCSLARTEIDVSRLSLLCVDTADPSRRRSIPSAIQEFRGLLCTDRCSGNKMPESGYNIVVHAITSPSLFRGHRCRAGGKI
jgi:hypothetical protein